ncbi:hypothetical protein T310_6027, partial [Rasamsonia emersonii CBS 393.64]
RVLLLHVPPPVAAALLPDLRCTSIFVILVRYLFFFFFPIACSPGTFQQSCLGPCRSLTVLVVSIYTSLTAALLLPPAAVNHLAAASSRLAGWPSSVDRYSPQFMACR